MTVKIVDDSVSGLFRLRLSVENEAERIVLADLKKKLADPGFRPVVEFAPGTALGPGAMELGVAKGRA